MRSKNEKLRFFSLRLSIAFAFLALSAVLVRAQTDPPDPPADDETVEPMPPPAPFEDPGVDGDPTPKEDLSVLGEPLLDGTLDLEVAGEEVDLPDALVPSQTATPPTCDGYNGSVTPLAIVQSKPHYFLYGGQPMLMVGVSADAGCHLDLEDGNVCRVGSLPGVTPAFPQSYPQILADAKAKGLNKIRLWVAFGGDPNGPTTTNTPTKQARNQPFLREGATYRLDQPNKDYFDRLRAVVIEAKKADLFVEVTFFSPFQGDHPDTKSLWLASNHLAKAPKADGSGLEEVGFTDLRWFALRSDASHPADDRMRQYQKNVIDWTIKWLWCYDNVWWEIANEPERADVDPILAAQWQQQMIAHTQQTEKTYPRLTARRLIAV